LPLTFKELEHAHLVLWWRITSVSV